MVALSRNVARKHAMEMLLTGDTISAEKAAAIGLVNEVVPPGHERARAIELAMQFASKSSHVIGIGKAAFYRQIEMPLAEAYAYASQGDDREHDGARRRGRHLRLHREARSKLGRPLMIATAA